MFSKTFGGCMGVVAAIAVTLALVTFGIAWLAYASSQRAYELKRELQKEARP